MRTASEVTAEPVDHLGCEGVTIRWLLDERDGAPNFYMRLFELAPAGCTPQHSHPWEHEVYVLEGEGIVEGANGSWKLCPGTVVFVAPNEPHCFRNTSTTTLKFLCLIPAHGKRA